MSLVLPCEGGQCVLYVSLKALITFMKRHPWILNSLLLLLLLGKTCIAQSQRPVLNRIKLPIDKNGILITCITQDHQGFMWFGTQNGLYRFDGYQTTSFKHDDNNLNSIGTDRVECIFVDKNNIIWIGTYGA